MPVYKSLLQDWLHICQYIKNRRFSINYEARWKEIDIKYLFNLFRYASIILYE